MANTDLTTDYKKLLSVYQLAAGRADKLTSNPSFLEKKMARFLYESGINYKFQQVFMIDDEHFFIADFVVPEKNLIIETDGGFHTGQKSYDEWRTSVIKEKYPEMKVLRFSYHEIMFTTDWKDAIKKICGIKQTPYERMMEKKAKMDKRKLMVTAIQNASMFSFHKNKKGWYYTRKGGTPGTRSCHFKTEDAAKHDLFSKLKMAKEKSC